MSTIEMMKISKRKFDRKSGDTTVRMTADENSSWRTPLEIFMDEENMFI